MRVRGIQHLAFLLGFLFSTASLGDGRLRIIYTGDLHGQMERTNVPGRGGFARLRTRIIERRAKAEADRVPILALDSGDFGEGGKTYRGAQGIHSWRAMNELDYDAVALGNHDYTVGAEELARLISQSQPLKFVPLMANLSPERTDLPNSLRENIRPFYVFMYSGIRVAVLGLTADEPYFARSLDPKPLWNGKRTPILNAIEAAKQWIPEARKRADVVIALTHLGMSKDLELVRATQGIDLVIGGHSHVELSVPRFAVDQSGKRVPILHGGEFGRTLNEVEIQFRNGKLSIAKGWPKLIPVDASVAEDPQMKELVSLAQSDFEAEYEAGFLQKKVGVSQVPLDRQCTHERTAWTKILTDSMLATARAAHRREKLAGGVDLAFEVSESIGRSQPAGPITRESLIELYPHTYDFKHPLGVHVWTVRVPGALLWRQLSQAVVEGRVVSLAGAKYTVKPFSDGSKHFQAGGSCIFGNARAELDRLYIQRANGTEEEITWTSRKFYTMAVSETVARIIDTIPLSDRIFRDAKNTGVPVIESVESELKRLGGVVPASYRRPLPAFLKRELF